MGENLTDTVGPVNTKKKRRRRKKKEPNDSTPQQAKEELNTEGLTDAQKELTTATLKGDASETKHEHESKANRQCSSLEQSSTTLHSSLNSTSESTKDSKTNIDASAAVERFDRTDEQCNKKQHTAPTLTMSYSDKVKSLASKNNSSYFGTEKSWVKDFTPDSSSVKHKHVQISQSHAGQGTLANNSSHGEMREMKGGKRTEEERGYHRLKDGDPSKSQSRKVEQIPRTGKQMGRNNSFKKITCDDDDNWRLKRDDAKVVDSAVSSRTDTLKKSNNKKLNTESLNKRACQEEVGADSQKFSNGGEHEKSVGHIVMDKVCNSSKKQQNLNQLGSGSTANEACTKLSSSGSDMQSGSQRAVDATSTLFVAPSNSRALEGEFPDLRDSVKIKRPLTAVDKRTVDHKEMISPPKPSAPMSYSAVLQTAPQPKVSFRLAT